MWKKSDVIIILKSLSIILLFYYIGLLLSDHNTFVIGIPEKNSEKTVKIRKLCENVFFSIKTTEENHVTRARVIGETWIPAVRDQV